MKEECISILLKKFRIMTEFDMRFYDDIDHFRLMSVAQHHPQLEVDPKPA